MASNKGKNTKPELLLRSCLHAMGYRFRLHRKNLPGTPDIVFGRRYKVIWIHGCFWHAHPGCRFATTPKTRADYWVPKLARNRERDEQHERMLHEMGWETLTVWECEMGNPAPLRDRLVAFLGPPQGGKKSSTA